MPPHIKFTPEIILIQAFEIVRQEGLDALSARRIAKELGCSTQPVYNAYKSMPELQNTVIEKAKEYALTYFSQELGVNATLSVFWVTIFSICTGRKAFVQASFFGWADRDITGRHGTALSVTAWRLEE